MKSTYTFPNSIDRSKQPHAYAPANVYSTEFTYVAPAGNQPYHLEKMEEMRQQVMNRARVNAFNDTNYCLGGNREMYLRNQQPQGSFARPLSLSGSVAYGTPEMRGGFRTREGQQIGIDLLQKRARQLEMLAQAQQTGEALRPVTSKTAIESEDPDVVALDLLLTQIEQAYSAGLIGDVTSAELRKFYALLKKVVMGLKRDEVNYLISRLAITLTSLEELVERTYDEGDMNTLAKTTFAFTILKKAYLVTRLAASTFGFDDKRRKVIFREMEKQIRGFPTGRSPITDKSGYIRFQGDLEEMDARFDDLLSQVAQEPKAEETAEFGETQTAAVRPQERERREAPLQGDDRDGQFAPGGRAMPFMPEVGQYDPYGEEYAVVPQQGRQFVLLDDDDEEEAGVAEFKE